MKTKARSLSSKTHGVIRNAFFRTAAAFIAISSTVFGQGNPDSPVFRDYKPARQYGLPRNPDPVRQWRELDLIRKANQGDQFAQHELGLRYLFGDGFAADTNKAALWIGRSAEQGLVPANFNMGLLLANGWGVEWNPFEAFRRFQSAAEKGMVEARHLLGMMYTEDLVVPRDWAKAEHWIKLAADSGYAASAEILKEISARAERARKSAPAPEESGASHASPSVNSWAPVLLDFDSARVAATPDLRTIARAAIASAGLGSSDSLSVMNALDNRSDDATFPAMLDSAVVFGNPEAVLLLAICRAGGVPAWTDRLQAAVSFIRAVYLDAPGAVFMLRQLTGRERFFAELRDRVSSGDPVAQFVQAELAVLGFDRTISEAQSLELLLASARSGFTSAAVHLGLRKQAGRGIPRDARGAISLWSAAAAAGDGEAALRLAAHTALSDAGAQEIESSISVLRLADGYGSIVARVALARRCELGRGVPQDAGTAARLYRSAAYRGSRSAFEALRRMHDRLRPGDEEFKTGDGA